jgi:hypothetical protein
VPPDGLSNGDHCVDVSGQGCCPAHRRCKSWNLVAPKKRLLPIFYRHKLPPHQAIVSKCISGLPWDYQK